jgi:hypothetical protein
MKGNVMLLLTWITVGLIISSIIMEMIANTWDGPAPFITVELRDVLDELSLYARALGAFLAIILLSTIIVLAISPA